MQRPISSTICRPAKRGNTPYIQWEADDMINDRFRLIDLIDDMCAGEDIFFRFVRTVKDIMPNNVKTLTLDDNVGKALQFMKQSNIRNVCVIDIPTGEEEQPYFVGVVSERDIFRQIPPNTEKINEAKTNPKALRQLLGQVITRKPKTVSPDTSMPIEEINQPYNHVDMVPVLDGEDLVSVITIADVMKLIVKFETIYRLSAKPKETNHSPNKNRSADPLSGRDDNVTSLLTIVLQPVEDIMTEQLVCLGTDDSLATVMESMKNGKFRHVPVVNEEGEMVGILSDRDVLHYLPFIGGQRLPRTGEFRSSLFHVDTRDPSLNLPISSIMTRNVTHIRPDCSLYDALKMLQELEISCLPVVDEGKKLRGIVTVTNIMRALLDAYELAEKSEA